MGAPGYDARIKSLVTIKHRPYYSLIYDHMLLFLRKMDAIKQIIKDEVRIVM